LKPPYTPFQIAQTRKLGAKIFCLLTGCWVLANLVLPVSAQQTKPKEVWVRKGPFFNSAGTKEKPTLATATDSSLTSSDGAGHENTITWSIPPATLVEGQEVGLTMHSTTNEGAPMVGGWRVRDVGERAATVLDTDVGSFAGFKKGTFNQARMVFKFAPGFNPNITLKAGRYDDYSGHMSMLVSWTYEKGLAPVEETAYADVFQFWEAKNKYRWCEEAGGGRVEFNRAPANLPPDGGMALVESPNGKVLETYPLNNSLEYFGGTTIWIPDDPGWEVVAYVPGTAIMHLEYSTQFTFPCKQASKSERLRAEIEVSGGVLHYIWNVITGQEHPDFVIIRTKDAIGGSKERPGNTGRNIPRDTSQTLRAAHHSNTQQRVPGIAERAFTVDQRDGRGTKFLVYKGEMEITPTNSTLKPFILRAGQQVQVSRSSISAITPVPGAKEAVAIADARRTHDLDESTADLDETDLVPLKLYWSAERGDNYATATPLGEARAKAAGYQFAGIQGYIFSTPRSGTIPLKTYWSAQRGDHFTTATAEGERAAVAAGYVFFQFEGFIYATQQPGTVPLKTFWSVERGDNFTTATALGEENARRDSYRLAYSEGYILRNRE
jgi:hypothetical protein